jgi:DNA-binding response OmpR family regulator
VSVLTVQHAEYRQGDVLHESRPGARFLHVSGPFVAGRTASLSGTPLELTPKEFDLLHLLARQPGRAYSREYLLQRIWGIDYGGIDRTVDAHVVRLRKKLGPFGDRLVTVWGVGYKLRAD